MLAADPTVLNAVLRRDFASFLRKTFHTLTPGQAYVPGWHIHAIAHRLQQVHTGQVRRLVINMPPRSLKSIAASVALPAYILGHDPRRRIICVSYSTEPSVDQARQQVGEIELGIDAIQAAIVAAADG